MRLRISEKVVGLKLDKFGGGMIGKRKGSGESDGENLERMRSILSLKNRCLCHVLKRLRTSYL